jgi:hypothetical protein
VCVCVFALLRVSATYLELRDDNYFIIDTTNE